MQHGVFLPSVWQRQCTVGSLIPSSHCRSYPVGVTAVCRGTRVDRMGSRGASRSVVRVGPARSRKSPFRGCAVLRSGDVRTNHGKLRDLARLYGKGQYKQHKAAVKAGGVAATASQSGWLSCPPDVSTRLGHSNVYAQQGQHRRVGFLARLLPPMLCDGLAGELLSHSPARRQTAPLLRRLPLMPSWPSSLTHFAPPAARLRRAVNSRRPVVTMPMEERANATCACN